MRKSTAYMLISIALAMPILIFVCIGDANEIGPIARILVSITSLTSGVVAVISLVLDNQGK